MPSIASVATFLLVVPLLATQARGGESGTPFADDFNAGASDLWGNQQGEWSASDGVYGAALPGNFPNACSLLPFDLVDFEVDVDVNDVSDGGIWLRATPMPGTPIGVKGVLLVTKGSGLYWHEVPSGNGYGASLGAVNGLFAPGSDIHLRVTVRCNVYTAYVNGSREPATSITSGVHASGQVGLYDFSAQTFDNFAVAEPFVECIADISGDCLVDGADITALLGNWGEPGEGDLNDDGTTDGADITMLLGSWGPC